MDSATNCDSNECGEGGGRCCCGGRERRRRGSRRNLLHARRRRTATARGHQSRGSPGPSTSATSCSRSMSAESSASSMSSSTTLSSSSSSSSYLTNATSLSTSAATTTSRTTATTTTTDTTQTGPKGQQAHSSTCSSESLDECPTSPLSTATSSSSSSSSSSSCCSSTLEADKKAGDLHGHRCRYCSNIGRCRQARRPSRRPWRRLQRSAGTGATTTTPSRGEVATAAGCSGPTNASQFKPGQPLVKAATTSQDANSRDAALATPVCASNKQELLECPNCYIRFPPPPLLESRSKSEQQTKTETDLKQTTTSSANLLHPMDFLWSRGAQQDEQQQHRQQKSTSHNQLQVFGHLLNPRAHSFTEASLTHESSKLVAKLAASARSRSLCTDNKDELLSGRQAKSSARQVVSKKVEDFSRYVGKLTRNAFERIRLASVSNPNVLADQEQHQQQQQQYPTGSPGSSTSRLIRRRFSSQRVRAGALSSTCSPKVAALEGRRRRHRSRGSLGWLVPSSGSWRALNEHGQREQVEVIPHQLNRSSLALNSYSGGAGCGGGGPEEGPAGDPDRLYGPGGVYVGPGGSSSWRECERQRVWLRAPPGPGATSWLGRPLRSSVAQALKGVGRSPGAAPAGGGGDCANKKPADQLAANWRSRSSSQLDRRAELRASAVRDQLLAGGADGGAGYPSSGQPVVIRVGRIVDKRPGSQHILQDSVRADDADLLFWNHNNATRYSVGELRPTNQALGTKKSGPKDADDDDDDDDDEHHSTGAPKGRRLRAQSQVLQATAATTYTTNKQSAWPTCCDYIHYKNNNEENNNNHNNNCNSNDVNKIIGPDKSKNEHNNNNYNNKQEDQDSRIEMAPAIATQEQQQQQQQPSAHRNRSAWLLNLTSQRNSNNVQHQKLADDGWPRTSASNPTAQIVHAGRGTKKSIKRDNSTCQTSKTPPYLIKENRSSSLIGFNHEAGWLIDVSRSSMELNRVGQELAQQTSNYLAQLSDRYSTSGHELTPAPPAVASKKAGEHSGAADGWLQRRLSSNQQQFIVVQNNQILINETQVDQLNEQQLNELQLIQETLDASQAESDLRNSGCGGSEQAAELYGANLQTSCVHCQLIAELSNHPNSTYLGQLVADGSSRWAASHREEERDEQQQQQEQREDPQPFVKQTKPSLVLTVCSNQGTLDEQSGDDNSSSAHRGGQPREQQQQQQQPRQQRRRKRHNRRHRRPHGEKEPADEKRQGSRDDGKKEKKSKRRRETKKREGERRGERKSASSLVIDETNKETTTATKPPEKVKMGPNRLTTKVTDKVGKRRHRLHSFTSTSSLISRSSAGSAPTIRRSSHQDGLAVSRDKSQTGSSNSSGSGNNQDGQENAANSSQGSLSSGPTSKSSKCSSSGSSPSSSSTSSPMSAPDLNRSIAPGATVLKSTRSSSSTSISFRPNDNASSASGSPSSSSSSSSSSSRSSPSTRPSQLRSRGNSKTRSSSSSGPQSGDSSSCLDSPKAEQTFNPGRSDHPGEDDNPEESRRRRHARKGERRRDRRSKRVLSKQRQTTSGANCQPVAVSRQADGDVVVVVESRAHVAEDEANNQTTCVNEELAPEDQVEEFDDDYEDVIEEDDGDVDEEYEEEEEDDADADADDDDDEGGASVKSNARKMMQLEVPVGSQANKTNRSASLDAPYLLSVPSQQPGELVAQQQQRQGQPALIWAGKSDTTLALAPADIELKQSLEDGNSNATSTTGTSYLTVVQAANKSNRSRSVDISLPVRPGESYGIGTGGGGGSEPTKVNNRTETLAKQQQQQAAELLLSSVSSAKNRSKAMDKSQAKKFIQGEIKVPCANGETRALKLFVNWEDNSINGEHLWVYMGSSSDACYVGESECLKHGPRLCCSACKITAHTSCISILIDKIKFICKHTFKDLTVSNPRHLKEIQQQNVIYHHWVHKRTHCGRCKQCTKTIGNTKLPFSSKEIQAITCSWCKVSYHNKENCYTLSTLTEPCTLGAHRESIIPPSWILKLPPSPSANIINNNKSQVQELKGHQIQQQQQGNLIELSAAAVNQSVKLNTECNHNKENNNNNFCETPIVRQQLNNKINRANCQHQQQRYASDTTLTTDTSGYMSADGSNVHSLVNNNNPNMNNNNSNELNNKLICDYQDKGSITNYMHDYAFSDCREEIIMDPSALHAADLSIINQTQGQQPRDLQQQIILDGINNQRANLQNVQVMRQDHDRDLPTTMMIDQQQQPFQTTAQSKSNIYQNFKIVPQSIPGVPNAGSKPVLVFVNPRSGGNQGAKMMQKFNWLLNPRQVFDLIQSGGPRGALELFRDVPNLRILTIGGDGTASWILSHLDDVGVSNRIPVAVLPLGTGNDLARALGWGGGYTDEPIAKILTQVRDGEIVQLDRWNLQVERNYEATPSSPSEFSSAGSGAAIDFNISPSITSSPSYHGTTSSTISIIDQTTNCDSSSTTNNMLPGGINTISSNTNTAGLGDEPGNDKLPMDVINNYFSFGVDAHIALEFHTAREAHPERFNSRLRNKMFYGQAGGKDLLKRKWKDLSNFVTLYCDGQDMTGRLKELKVHSVLFLNIPSYGGGTRPWPTTTTAFSKPRTDDGLIEVIGLTTYQLPLLQAGGHGTCIAQCRSAKIITSKTIPMQVDGEPCKLLPSIITISFKNRVCMLAKSKSGGHQQKFNQ